MRLEQIASRLKAELWIRGDHASAETNITGVAAHAAAGATELVFAESEAALRAAGASRAAAIITARTLAAAMENQPASIPLLIADQPKLAFAHAACLLRVPTPSSGIHATAIIDPSSTLGAGTSVGPAAVVHAGVSVGAHTVIETGVVIGAGSRLGEGCHLYPRVVLYPGTQLGDRVIVHAGAVLGADGFGYVRDRTTGGYTQFPQQGRLIIEDDVEIGANTTIDRGALEATRIGCGTKLDNLVHVGHNVSIGRNVVIAAQTGISGSSVIGDGAVIGGQVGLGDHAEVGAGVFLGGQAGVLPGKRVTGPGAVLWGTPAKPLKQYLRELAVLARLARRARLAPPQETE
jgi:UDP-3-O-[3-hydroxymyristoyl] glucosamine N-acyltransferase